MFRAQSRWFGCLRWCWVSAAIFGGGFAKPEVGVGPTLPHRCVADFGGVPQEILYDRMKTVVIGADADGAAIYNPSLIALASHYAYQPRACRPYRAKTKGKVERPYRYIRQDFFLRPQLSQSR